MKKAVALGAKLFTQTPVTSIGRTPSSELWTVVTSRGNLLAKNVVHATNGYASCLLPELTNKLLPVKGHAAAALPPKDYYDRPLQTSFGFQWGPDFDYLIQRRHGERHFIYGGRDLWASGDPAVGVGDSDDSFVYPAHVESLRRFPSGTFKGWTMEDAASTTQVWSGIMGFVVDDFPYLGAVPNKPGQYICAGYNGSGMSSYTSTVMNLLLEEALTYIINRYGTCISMHKRTLSINSRRGGGPQNSIFVL